MAYLHDETTPTAVPERVWSGTIATDATNMDDPVSVVIPGLTDHMRWEQCHWQPKDNITLPKRGDQCVVVMDDNGELWVTAWGDLPDVSNGQWIKGVNNEAVWSDIVAADIKSPVNGQWIKGVGGVATWQPITSADLPPIPVGLLPQIPQSLLSPNVGPLTQNWNANDLNAITDSGWYNGSVMGNAPEGRGDWIFVLHMSHTGGSHWATQHCWTMQVDPVIQYVRSKINYSWYPWMKVTGIRGQFYCGPGSHATYGGGFGAYDVDGDHVCYVYFSPALSYTPVITTSVDTGRTAIITSSSSGGFYCTIQSQGGGYGQANVMFMAMPPS